MMQEVLLGLHCMRGRLDSSGGVDASVHVGRVGKVDEHEVLMAGQREQIVGTVSRAEATFSHQTAQLIFQVASKGAQCIRRLEMISFR